MDIRSEKISNLIRNFGYPNMQLKIGGQETTLFNFLYWAPDGLDSASSLRLDAEKGKDKADLAPCLTTPGSIPSSNLGALIMTVFDGRAAVGVAQNGKYVAELNKIDGESQFATYDSKKGVFKAGVMAADDEKANISKYEISKTTNPVSSDSLKEGHYATVLLLSLIPELLKHEEFKSNWDNIFGILNKARDNGVLPSDDEKAALNKSLAIMTDNAHLRIYFQELSSSIYVDLDRYMTENRTIPLIKKEELKGRYAPATEEVGHFKLLSVSTGRKEEVESVEDVWEKYKLTSDYERNPAVPQVDKNATVIPDYVETICSHVIASPKFRNFGFRGEAGAGKTFSAKLIASLLHIPHYIFTCSANTEICDFQGQIIPKLDDEDASCIHYTYAESPLVQAVRNGGVLEIQEPNVIIQPGVIVGLNGVMEPNGVLILPTGERIQRHPNTIIVITTNVSYEGCRDMNVSLLDRLDMVFDVNSPSASELAERCQRQTGFEDTALLNEMAEIVSEISTEMAKRHWEEGTAGLRSLINWAESTKITGDPYASGMYTLIPKTSSNKEDRDLLAKTLNAASFAKRTRTKRI